MYRVEKTLVNELGNKIEMAVTYDERGVTVYASGPTSEVEHTWTTVEAMWLMEMLMHMHVYAGSNEGVHQM